MVFENEQLAHPWNNKNSYRADCSFYWLPKQIANTKSKSGALQSKLLPVRWIILRSIIDNFCARMNGQRSHPFTKQ